MRHWNTRARSAVTELSPFMAVVVTLLLATAAHAAAPGITGTTFSLTAQANYISQPDGAAVYSWGYGCASTFSPSFRPTAIAGAKCPMMQIPGPTLIVTEGQTVPAALTKNLPTA